MDQVTLDRLDVIALLNAYRNVRGVTEFYTGDALIERVCVALGQPHQNGSYRSEES